MQVALLYGGRSAEHEVSINSAFTIHQALLQAGYSVLLIAITIKGRWFLQQELNHQFDTSQPLNLRPGVGIFKGEEKLSIDAAFATTHGYQGPSASASWVFSASHCYHHQGEMVFATGIESPV